MSPTVTKPVEPVARRYKVRVNAKAGDREKGPGAFNNVCVVYEGDEFFLTVPPIDVPARDANGVLILNAIGEPKTERREGKLPAWCDVIDEYPLDSTPKPLSKTN